MCWKSKSPGLAAGLYLSASAAALLCDPGYSCLPVEWVDTDYNAWIMAETKAREIDTDRLLRAGG